MNLAKLKPRPGRCDIFIYKNFVSASAALSKQKIGASLLFASSVAQSVRLLLLKLVKSDRKTKIGLFHEMTASTLRRSYMVSLYCSSLPSLINTIEENDKT